MNKVCKFFFVTDKQRPLNSTCCFLGTVVNCHVWNSGLAFTMLIFILTASVIMVSVLASSRSWFKSRSGQTRDYRFGICFLSTKHTTLMSKIKY
jgi:hypothetical protein